MLTPQKESYDKSRQSIKKERCHFPDKCPYSQSYSFPSSHVWVRELDHKEGWVLKSCGAGKDAWESLGLQGDQIRPFQRKSTLNTHWKDCWESSKTLATWCKESTHWKRPWFWERFKSGGEEDNRGWGDWMASPTQWTWVWVNSSNWWWTGRSDVQQSMGSQRVGDNWVTELNWKIK